MSNPQAEQTQSDLTYDSICDANGIPDASKYRNIYYLGRDGNVSCGSTKPNEGELEKYANVFNPPTNSLRLAGKDYDEGPPSAASHSRLTLMLVAMLLGQFDEGSNCFNSRYLDVYFKVKPLETEALKTKPCPPQYPDRVDLTDEYDKIPKRYRNELGGSESDDKNKFCYHCSTVMGEILWRNIVEAQSRYECRFRTWKSDFGVCFL